MAGRWTRRGKEFSDAEVALGRRSEEIVDSVLPGVSKVSANIDMAKRTSSVCLPCDGQRCSSPSLSMYLQVGVKDMVRLTYCANMT